MRVIKFVLLLVVFLNFYDLSAQDLPADELQATLNSYSDNFGVSIFYPSLSFTKAVREKSTVNVRYLVDAISSASMKSHFDVDGVSSATKKDHGGGDDAPDEVRQEFGLGIQEVMSGGVLKNSTIAINGLYSVEHDYASKTFTSTYTYQMAKKNSTLSLGIVRRWDRVFPQIRDWEKKTNVISYSGTYSQILNAQSIVQLIYSYSEMEGFLSDAYMVVSIIDDAMENFTNYEPVHPGTRVRRAFGGYLNYKSGNNSAINIGLRYYNDSWDVRSLTSSIGYQHHLNPAVTLGFTLRNYTQKKAFFFKPRYLWEEEFMTVDPKLDDLYSNDYQFKLTIKGGQYKGLPLLSNPKLECNLRMNFYHRHNETPNWHSRQKNLYAMVVSFGVRYHL
ncbi:MAG: DUF3570 domain-containing protein [Deferribacteres bacterium]|nr:DUF3570 domain-containing protein [candidate division KSB1 bacterium]MCB9500630.1 DUF3570 domain-containing protein [Deferribacteres bacterium]